MKDYAEAVARIIVAGTYTYGTYEFRHFSQCFGITTKTAFAEVLLH